MSNKYCNEDLKLMGMSYPRTCAKCGLGPCHKTLPPDNMPSVGLEDSIKLLQRHEVNQSLYVEGWNDALSMVLFKLKQKAQHEQRTSDGV